jgi:hypothetical protein
VTLTVRIVDRDPLALGVAIVTVHAGRRAQDSAASPAPPPALDEVDALSLVDTLSDGEPAAVTEDDPYRDDPAVTDGQLILDLIGHDATSQDVGELIVALGMLGAILAEEAGAATGRDAGDVLREIALRYAA